MKLNHQQETYQLLEEELAALEKAAHLIEKLEADNRDCMWYLEELSWYVEQMQDSLMPMMDQIIQEHGNDPKMLQKLQEMNDILYQIPKMPHGSYPMPIDPWIPQDSSPQEDKII